MNLKQSFKDFFNTFLSLFIPDKCFKCQGELGDSEFYICKECLDLLPRYKNDRENIFSLFEFNTTTRKLIWLLKYDKKPELGQYLGRYLYSELLKHNLLPDLDYALLPIPLHPKRLKKRGYNQALMISDGFRAQAREQFKVIKNLKRVKNNVSQTTLSREKRKGNVSGIFLFEDSEFSLTGKNCIIVDDVVTTGSTINELNQEVTRAEVKNVFGLTLISAQKLKYNYEEGA